MQSFKEYIKESEDEYYYHGTSKEAYKNIKKEGLKGSDSSPLYVSKNESGAAYYAGKGTDGKERGEGVVVRVHKSKINKTSPHREPSYLYVHHEVSPEHLEVGVDRGKNGIWSAKSWKKVR